MARDGRPRITSAETKAIETATLLADHLGLEIEVRVSTGENDCTATGFAPDVFERHADVFFADPEASVDGWGTGRRC
ncbi:MAG: hypothetical protein R2695_13030 [Acidimicrobiales bacterium]